MLWVVLALKVPEEEVLGAHVEPAGVLRGVSVANGVILLLDAETMSGGDRALICSE